VNKEEKISTLGISAEKESLLVKQHEIATKNT
jgi:hypothetical protein